MKSDIWFLGPGFVPIDKIGTTPRQAFGHLVFGKTTKKVRKCLQVKRLKSKIKSDEK